MSKMFLDLVNCNFCSDMQLVGSEFGVNNINSWTDSVSSSSWWWRWCNGAGTQWLFNTTWTKFECCYWPCGSLYGQSFPSSNGNLQHDYAPCHEAQVISTGSMNLTMSCRAGLNWDVVEWEQMCSWKKSEEIMSTKVLRNISNILWNPCHEGLRLFWEQRGVLPSISIMSLKWQ